MSHSPQAIKVKALDGHVHKLVEVMEAKLALLAIIVQHQTFQKELDECLKKCAQLLQRENDDISKSLLEATDLFTKNLSRRQEMIREVLNEYRKGDERDMVSLKWKIVECIQLDEEDKQAMDTVRKIRQSAFHGEGTAEHVVELAHTIFEKIEAMDISKAVGIKAIDGFINATGLTPQTIHYCIFHDRERDTYSLFGMRKGSLQPSEPLPNPISIMIFYIDP